MARGTSPLHQESGKRSSTVHRSEVLEGGQILCKAFQPKDSSWVGPSAKGGKVTHKVATERASEKWARLEKKGEKKSATIEGTWAATTMRVLGAVEKKKGEHLRGGGETQD